MNTNYFLELNQSLPIVIVGNVGKTILKQLLLAVFHDQILALSSDNHVTNSYEIKKLKDESIKKQQPYLLNLQLNEIDFESFFIEISPKIIIVTNIGSNYQNVKQDQFTEIDEIRSFISKTNNDCIIVLNKDDDAVSDLEDYFPDRNILKFGLNTNADFYATNLYQNGIYGIEFKFNKHITYDVPIYDFYQIYNVLAAILIGRLFKKSHDKIRNNISKYFQVPEGRCSLHKCGKYYIIDHTLQNSIQSIAIAAQTLVNFKKNKNRIIMIIGSLDDNEINNDQQYINIGHFLAALPIDVIVTVGEKVNIIAKTNLVNQNNDRIILTCNDIQEALMNILLFINEQDCLMFKGSSKSGLNQLIKILEEKIKPTNS